MNEANQDLPEPGLIAALRADFSPAGAAVRKRVSERLVLEIGALAMKAGAGQSSPDALTQTLTVLKIKRASLLLSFVLGASFGAGSSALLRPTRAVPAAAGASPRPSVASAEPQLPSRNVSPPSLTPIAAMSGNAPVPALALANPPAQRSAPASTASLGEQQTLLDAARSAFARADYDACHRILVAHAKRYPQSILAEEREALGIKTMAANGQMQAAQARALRFKNQFPQSLLLPSLNDSVGVAP